MAYREFQELRERSESEQLQPTTFGEARVECRPLETGNMPLEPQREHSDAKFQHRRDTTPVLTSVGLCNAGLGDMPGLGDCRGTPGLPGQFDAPGDAMLCPDG